MKKIFLLLAFMLTVQLSIAQTATEAVNAVVAVAETAESVDVGINEAERIVDKYGAKVSNVIEGLAESLAVTAEHVYGVLVWQQLAEGISIVILFIFWLVLIKVFWNLLKKADFTDDTGNRYATLSIVSGVASAILGVMLIFYLPESIIKIINPEYGAIKEIFDLVKGM